MSRKRLLDSFKYSARDPPGFARGRLFTSLENASFRMTVFFLKEVDLLLLSSWVLVDRLTKES